MIFLLFFLAGIVSALIMLPLLMLSVEEICDRAMSRAIKKAFKEEK